MGVKYLSSQRSKALLSKKGFTLIELLAVIIILGVLLLIAIPSVTEYITMSKRKTYITTAVKYIDAVINKVNALDYNFSSTDTMYYVSYKCVELEKGGKSPYGEWTEAYVVVTFDGDSYKYYWTSVDEAGMGIELTLSKNLNPDKIKGGMTNVDKTKTAGGRTKIGEIPLSCGSEPVISDIPGGGTPIEEDDPIDPSNPNRTITYNCNGIDCTLESKTVILGEPYGDLPEPPTRSGYIFDGWYTAATGGDKIESTTIVSTTKHQTLYAHWIESGQAQLLSAVVTAGDYVNYDAGNWTETKAKPSNPFYFGGYTAGSSRNSSVTCYNSATNSGWRVLDVDNDIVTLIHAGMPECYFHYDYLYANGNSEKILTGSTTFTISSSYPSEPRDWSMYVDSRYATSATAFTKQMLDKWYGSDSASKTITDGLIDINGFYWLATGKPGDASNLTYVNQGGGVVYGQTDYPFGIRPVVKLKLGITTSGKTEGVWSLKEQINPSYTISYDCNGIACSLGTKAVIQGGKYGILPQPPVRTGYSFDGWYTATTGGSKIDSSTTVTITSNQTLYAQWNEVEEAQKLVDVVAVGDYVNYDAGTWTETMNKPTVDTPFTFGGYTSGSSRNSSVSCKELPTSSGWRVLSKNAATGEVKLIHAGQPECYFHPNITNARGNSENILTGTTSYDINTNRPSTPRDWSMYVNSSYAVSATAFTKAMLDSWNGSTVSYTATITDDLIKTNASYWLGSARPEFLNNLLFISNLGRMDNYYNNAYGIRPVITMKPNITTTGQVGNIWQLQ